MTVFAVTFFFAPDARTINELFKRRFMAKDDLSQIDGKVIDLTAGGNYKIELENGFKVSARLCGKMKKFSTYLTNISIWDKKNPPQH